MMFLRPLSAFLLPFLAAGFSRAETINIDLSSKYGLTLKGINQAVQDAKAHFAQNPDDTLILNFPPGLIDFSKDKSTGPSKTDRKGKEEAIGIELSGVKPGDSGHLIFKGAGQDKTTLLFPRDMTQFDGRGVYHVTVSGFHLASVGMRTTQGHVVSVAPGVVVIDLQDGFPTLADVFNSVSHQGRYLRKYTDSKTDPQLITDDNTQVPWSTAQLISGQRWQINLKRSGETPNYARGDLIGIKSKVGGQAYWFSGGSDFTFDDIKWTQESRGVFRSGFNQIKILNCDVEREPPINGQTPCLSTSGGGPQIGQPNDAPTTGNVVDNYRAEGTGDDSVAFFNGSGTINNVKIADSFGRGILLYHSPNVTVTNADVQRCQILRQ
jgi:hypothetical protein